MTGNVQAGPAGLLRNKTFTRVYAAYTAATFGDWFDMLAIQVLVGYRWEAGPLMLALIPVANALPSVLLGSFAGVVADRIHQLKLMRLCDLLTAALTLMILLSPNMLWLLPVLTLRATLSTFIIPAQQSLTRSIVREDQLFQATSLNGFVNQGSKIAGPLLGGFALALLTPEWCILLNVCFRMFSLVILLTIKKVEVQFQKAGRNLDRSSSSALETAEDTSLRTLWIEGLRCILRTRLLLVTLLFGFVATAAIQMIDFQFTSLFREIAPLKEAYLSWMVAAAGVGAVMIIAVLNRWNQGAAGYAWKFSAGYGLIGMAVGGLGLLPTGSAAVPILLLGFGLGVGNGVVVVTFNYCLQKETPADMVGRVFGIQTSLLGLVMLVAPLLGGLLVEWIGPGRSFIYLGGVIAALGLLVLALGKVLWRSEDVSVVRSDAKRAIEGI
ncbi:Major Facilitator Superfamily protein [Paenibacillus barengoltzii]|uniref:MFS transporter n=1 Tax=Paenibacillus barengoltzii TaxID=343517 RepID=UPI000A08D2D7|nr:MFS transporter [Paenibacillus barengoltzii]SME99258.1 Major Facilitator Superfamily protein [Paenibacillus barengoltzii]